MLSDGFLNRAQKKLTMEAAVKSASIYVRYGSVRYQSSEAVTRKRKQAKAGRLGQLRVCECAVPSLRSVPLHVLSIVRDISL